MPNCPKSNNAAGVLRHRRPISGVSRLASRLRRFTSRPACLCFGAVPGTRIRQLDRLGKRLLVWLTRLRPVFERG